MSHFTVLVIGENWEQQLDPFWELDLSPEDLKTDYRAEFIPEISAKDLTIEFKKFKEENPERSGNYKNKHEWVKDWHNYSFDPKTKSYGHYYNPESKWDWYIMGGRWRGFFKLKNPTSEFVVGEPGVFDNEALFDSDQATKGEIDFQGMRDNVVKFKLETYNKFQEILAGRQLPSWSEVFARHGKDKIEDARKEYHDNPVVKDLFDARFWDLEEFTVDRETYLRLARDGACVTYAVVKDGVWYEHGTMGWWGMSSNEKPEDEWNKEFTKLIDSLPDETLLTLVDCHI